MQNTGIEWADHTINQYVGCSAISPGCNNCYAEAIENRFGRNFAVIRKTKNYENGELARFLRKTKPSRIFADSMFDYFHEQMSYEQIAVDLEFLASFPQHQFMILTKRIGRAWHYCKTHKLPRNIWLGTSIENRKNLWRLGVLQNIDASIRFISFEPLLEDLGQLNLNFIDWAIVGGESGPHHRPFDLNWARNILRYCRLSPWHTAFFFKQVGGFTPKAGGRLLDGKTYDEVPLVRY